MSYSPWKRTSQVPSINYISPWKQTVLMLLSMLHLCQNLLPLWKEDSLMLVLFLLLLLCPSLVCTDLQSPLIKRLSWPWPLDRPSDQWNNLNQNFYRNITNRLTNRLPIREGHWNLLTGQTCTSKRKHKKCLMQNIQSFTSLTFGYELKF